MRSLRYNEFAHLLPSTFASGHELLRLAREGFFPAYQIAGKRPAWPAWAVREWLAEHVGETAAEQVPA